LKIAHYVAARRFQIMKYLINQKMKRYVLTIYAFVQIVGMKQNTNQEIPATSANALNVAKK